MTRPGPGVLGALAIALLVVAVLNLALSYALGLPIGDSTLNYVRRVALGHVGDDSWAAMAFAWDYWRERGQPGLYAETLDGGVKYIYPPIAMLLVPAVRSLGDVVPSLDPFAFLRIVGWAGLLATWFVTVRLAVVAQQPRQPGTAAVAAGAARNPRAPLPMILAGAAATLLFYPLTWGYNLGQVQTWITALLAVALLCFASGRPALAGAIVGTVCLLKPHLGYLLLWALVAREYRFAASGLACAGVGALASLAVFGWPLHADYVELMRELSQRGEAYYQNHSVNGLLNRLVSVGDPARYANAENFYTFPAYHPIVHVGTLASSAALLAAGLVHGWRHGATLPALALAITLTIIASPLAWQHHYGVLLPIGTWAATRALPHSRILAALALAGLLLIGMYAPAVRTLAPDHLNVLQSYALFGALLVAAVLVTIARRDARIRSESQLRRLTPTSSSWA